MCRSPCLVLVGARELAKMPPFEEQVRRSSVHLQTLSLRSSIFFTYLHLSTSIYTSYLELLNYDILTQIDSWHLMTTYWIVKLSAMANCGNFGRRTLLHLQNFPCKTVRKSIAEDLAKSKKFLRLIGKSSHSPSISSLLRCLKRIRRPRIILGDTWKWHVAFKYRQRQQQPCKEH